MAGTSLQSRKHQSSAVTEAALPVEHSLQMNLPFGISESPRHCRWKAPQHCASHSNNSPGFSQICREETQYQLEQFSSLKHPRQRQPPVVAGTASSEPLGKNAVFILCQLILVVCNHCHLPWLPDTLHWLKCILHWSHLPNLCEL